MFIDDLGPNKSKTLIPDSIEPLIGWRSWQIVKSYGEPMLLSPQRGMSWLAGQRSQAICMHDETARLKCQCGINAFTSLDQLQSRGLYDRMPVIGEVALWGEVQTYERGYRGQYAYPAKLYATNENNEEDVKRAAEIYAIPYGGVLKPSKTSKAGQPFPPGIIPGIGLGVGLFGASIYAAYMQSQIPTALKGQVPPIPLPPPAPPGPILSPAFQKSLTKLGQKMTGIIGQAEALMILHTTYQMKVQVQTEQTLTLRQVKHKTAEDLYRAWKEKDTRPRPPLIWHPPFAGRKSQLGFIPKEGKPHWLSGYGPEAFLKEIQEQGL